MNDTFFLSNIVPQDMDNNAGFWNRFEIYCRDLTKTFDHVYVISGPLFMSYAEGDKKFVKYQVGAFLRLNSGLFLVQAITYQW